MNYLFICLDLSPLGCKKLCRDPVYPPVVCSTLLNHTALFKKLTVIPLSIYYQFYLLFFNLRRQGQFKVLVFCYFVCLFVVYQVQHEWVWKTPHFSSISLIVSHSYLKVNVKHMSVHVKHHFCIYMYLKSLDG